MMANFQFLSAHLCIWADHSQLGSVHTPVLQVDPEGEVQGEDDYDAASVTCCPAHPSPALVKHHVTRWPPGQQVGLASE